MHNTAVYMYYNSLRYILANRTKYLYCTITMLILFECSLSYENIYAWLHVLMHQQKFTSSVWLKFVTSADKIMLRTSWTSSNMDLNMSALNALLVQWLQSAIDTNYHMPHVFWLLRKSPNRIKMLNKLFYSLRTTCLSLISGMQSLK